ncbi:MAG: hypothetical protein JJ992_01810, partial [Planctomycetes bacterium]|nr:hypothetical protein [Planctomycetota bacterium]
MDNRSAIVEGALATIDFERWWQRDFLTFWRDLFTTVYWFTLDFEYQVGFQPPPLSELRQPPTVQVDPPPFSYKIDATYTLDGIQGRVTVDGGTAFESQGDQLIAHNQDGSVRTGSLASTTIGLVDTFKYQVFLDRTNGNQELLVDPVRGSDGVVRYYDQNGNPLLASDFETRFVPAGTSEVVDGQSYGVYVDTSNFFTKTLARETADGSYIDSRGNRYSDDDFALSRYVPKLKPSPVPVYETDADGAVKTDANGRPLVRLTTSGNPVLSDGFVVEDQNVYRPRIGDHDNDPATPPQQLTRSFLAIQGLGMGRGDSLDGTPYDGVEYVNMEAMTVYLTDDDDQFTIDAAHAGQTTIIAGDGDDSVTVRALAGPAEVLGGAGDDSVRVESSAADLSAVIGRLTFDGDGNFDEISGRVPFDPALHQTILDTAPFVYVNSGDADGSFVDSSGRTVTYAHEERARLVFVRPDDGNPDDFTVAR